MERTSLPCNLIEFAKPDKEYRSFNKEFAVKMSGSILVEGLYNPIVVRRNPDKPGYYIGVQGLHRHFAVSKVLKWEVIDCTILGDDFDAEDHRMSQITENLWRNPLTKDQHLISIKKWHEYYALKHPVAQNAAQAGGKASVAARRKKKVEAEVANGRQDVAGSVGGEATTVEPPADAAEATQEAAREAEKTFTDHVAAATGRTRRTAQRAVRLAKMFSEDELETFRQCYVSDAQIDRISRISDPKQRSEVVSLVASGLEVDDAIKEVVKEGEVVEQAEAKKEEKEAKAAAKEEKAPELTDDEWFVEYCGETAKLFADPTKYKADAILFRHITEHRAVFRSKIKAKVKAHREGGNPGLLVNLLNRLINLSHPKDWLICNQCSGKGVGGDGERCPKCNGGGYNLRTEQY